MAIEILEFVPLRQAAKEVGYSVSSYYRAVKDGRMPAPVEIGPKRVAVPRHELEAAKRAILTAAGRDVAA
jgi:predicted DNA-binding transcriptional regulator AlpA